MVTSVEKSGSSAEACEPAPHAGVDYYFRTELALGLGAARSANRINEDSSETEVEAALLEGSAWAVRRTRFRIDGSEPSYRTGLENVIWNIFSSEEQIAYMSGLIRNGHVTSFVAHTPERVFLVGDGTSWNFRGEQLET